MTQTPTTERKDSQNKISSDALLSVAVLITMITMIATVPVVFMTMPSQPIDAEPVDGNLEVTEKDDFSVVSAQIEMEMVCEGSSCDTEPSYDYYGGEVRLINEDGAYVSDWRDVDSVEDVSVGEKFVVSSTWELSETKITTFRTERLNNVKQVENSYGIVFREGSDSKEYRFNDKR